MGERGPAPLPVPMKKARGTYREDRHGGSVEYPAGRPTCPNFLSSEAKREWRRQVPHLLQVGVLCEVDRAVLAAYCEAWGEFVDLVRLMGERARAAVQAASDAGLPAAHWIGGDEWMSLLRAKNGASERVLRLAGHFGFSPAARTRIKAEAVPGREDTDGEAPALYRIHG